MADIQNIITIISTEIHSHTDHSDTFIVYFYYIMIHYKGIMRKSQQPFENVSISKLYGKLQRCLKIVTEICKLCHAEFIKF